MSHRHLPAVPKPPVRAFSAFRASAVTLLLCATLCLSLPLPVLAAPAIPPAALVRACSAVVYDLDNDAILFEQNADERIPPASLTKVLSMFLALDHLKAGHVTLHDPVTISARAAGTGGSRMGLRQGERVSLEQLLLGMAVSSGNDASHAVAELVGGSWTAFVTMMNLKARQLGMHDSHFCNPHGLPAADQYTTARDMLTLARAYLRAHPEALRYHNERQLTHRGLVSTNKNPLLGQYPGADGLKTGWIRASGYNLIFTAVRGKARLLAVIMGAPDVRSRGMEAGRLLDAAFRVSDNDAVSVAAALEQMPTPEHPVAVRKAPAQKRYAQGKSGKHGRATYAAASKKTAQAAKARKHAAPGKHAARQTRKKARAS